MDTATCTAVADGDRIQLVIRKGEPGYEAFVDALVFIERDGFMSWYGDVQTPEGDEQCGLILTRCPRNNPNALEGNDDHAGDAPGREPEVDDLPIGIENDDS